MKATYTQWSLFDTCPHWYWRLYIEKDVERQTSDALEKGIRVHDGIERYLLGETDELPEEVHKSWKAMLTGLRGVSVEVRLDNDVAYGKLDAYQEGIALFDWKTGKARINDLKMRDQLRFYVWLAGEDLDAHLCWVEHPENKAHLSLPLKWTTTLDKVWRNRIDKMQAGPYPVTPNWKCAWCPVKECPHNKAENNE